GWTVGVEVSGVRGQAVCECPGRDLVLLQASSRHTASRSPKQLPGIMGLDMGECGREWRRPGDKGPL
ncbi:hypothetical protein JOQ06_019532, partial [Pogonophryne albipinna]